MKNELIAIRFPLLAFALLALALPASAQTGRDDDDDEAIQASDEPAIYDAQGRRDPFRPTIGGAEGSEGCGGKPGMAGLLLQEVSLTGIVATSSGPISQWEGGPAEQGYFARVGDSFCDGKIQAIDYELKVVTVRQERKTRRGQPSLLRPWKDTAVYLFPEQADAAGAKQAAFDAAVSTGSGRRGPGNLARPDTSARPGTIPRTRQR